MTAGAWCIRRFWVSTRGKQYGQDHEGAPLFQVPGDRKTTYRVRFTQNAFLVLQQATGKGISELSRAGIVELQQLLWGGLEGARLKDRTTRHGRPFDMLDVGDLLETIYENDGKVFDLDAQAEVRSASLSARHSWPPPRNCSA